MKNNNTPLEGREIEIGYIANDLEGLETAIPLLKEIIEPDLNKYASKLNYNVRFNFVLDNAQGKAATHLEKVQGFKARGINLFIGGGYSSFAQSSLSYCNDNDMLMWSPSSSSPLLAIENDNFFRMCPDDTIQAPVISEMIQSRGVKRIIVLQRGDAWADGIYNYFEPAFLVNNGEITKRTRYNINENDFSHILQHTDELMRQTISESGVGEFGILVLCFDEIVNIIKQAQNYPDLLDVPWFGSDGTVFSKKILDETPYLASKVKLFSTYTSPVGSSKFADLYDRYYGLTNQPLGFYSACIYDIAWIIAQGILEAQSTAATDIIPLIPRLTANHFGSTGWSLINEAGDRANTNYLIWGYTLNDENPECSVHGYYDSITGEIHWDYEIVEEQRNIFDSELDGVEKEYTNERGLLVSSLTDNLRYIDINFERVFGTPFFQPKLDDIRAVSDLYKICFEETDFVLRLASLSNLFDRVDRKGITIKHNGKYDLEKNSLFILQEMISGRNPDSPKQPFDELRKIRTLRNIFPIHDSNYSKLKKLEQIGITGYPFEWEHGWKIVLEKTVDLLSEIVSMLKQLH